MSLLARLFSPRKTNGKAHQQRKDNTTVTEARSSPHTLNKAEVRVLLFRECDWRGRKLLFDNTCVEKVTVDQPVAQPRSRSNSVDNVIEISNGYGYKYKKPHSDTSSLGETVFGSVAMATRGPSLKVHLLKDPSRIMFTKVFQTPRSGDRRREISNEKNLNESQGSSVNSMPGGNSGSFDSRLGSFEITPGDSGFEGRDSSECFGLSSQQCSCPLHLSASVTDNGDHANSSSSLQSGSSLCSLRRRWARSMATALDSSADQSAVVHATGKRTKLAVAIVVPLAAAEPKEMEQYLLDRLPVVCNILTRLQHSTERAYSRRDRFVQSMFQASNHAVQSVYEMVCGLRLERPLWLSLAASHQADSLKAELEKKLVSDLAYLLASLDTKDTNFFISTLLTAVLTHHLGWVPTVFSDLPHSENMFAELSKSHPYNPLWAQLSDLQGALGYPPKIAKTVVVGESEPVIQKLLSVLSYFIRCGSVSASELQRETPANEESELEFILEHGGEKPLLYKEAIKEFSKAGSCDGSISPSSSTTLTKSKTVLSMKTFSVIDCDPDVGNSLESGFESCNDISGESFEAKPLQTLGTKFVKTKSCSKLMETSFSKRLADCFDSERGEMSSRPISPNHLVVARIETDHKNVCKTESERQLTSNEFVNVTNQNNSKSSLCSTKSRHSSFIKENLIQADKFILEDKDKVVFVLGENEELVNLKPQSESKVPDILIEPPPDDYDKTCVGSPTVFVNYIHSDETDMENETENKTEFVTGDVSNKVVIARSTPIDIYIEKSRTLKAGQLHRCLSVPEEAVSETDWVKSRRRRSREAAQLIRRWLSDSVIERTSSGVGRGEGGITEPAECETPATVFRTSNRTLVDATSALCDVGELVDQDDANHIPKIVLEPVPYHRSDLDDYVKLPSQSHSLERRPTEVTVAASLFGASGDHLRPDLVLQAVTGRCTAPVAPDIRRTLALEARSAEADHPDLAEAVCVLADANTWEVSVVSSHSSLVDGGSGGGGGGGLRVGMSQLVANMLEGLQQLVALALPPGVCLSHLEHKLYELCVRSHALAELLVESDFLDMASLTSALGLDPNDVPLLLAVASTHTPAVTRKYGLSFQ